MSDVGFFGSMIAGIVLLVVVCCTGVNWLMTNSCERSGHRLSLETDYDFWSGTCYATLPSGKVIDLDSYRATDDAKR